MSVQFWPDLDVRIRRGYLRVLARVDCMLQSAMHRTNLWYPVTSDRFHIDSSIIAYSVRVHVITVRTSAL